jgi:HlyD family secretion protein
MKQPETMQGRVRRQTVWRWARRALLGVAAAGLVLLLVLAWLPQPVPVHVAEVGRGLLEVTIREDGKTRVMDRHVVAAPVTGTLLRMEIEPGDTVEEGMPLARLVPLPSPLLDERAQAQAQARVAAAQQARSRAVTSIERSEAALSFARSQRERLKGLVERGAASAADVDRADLEVRTAEQQLASARFERRIADYEVEMARAGLGYASPRPRRGEAAPEALDLRSPVRGRVLRKLQESEGVVQVGAPLLEIGDPAALEVVIDVLTTDAVRIPEGARVVLTHWGGDTALDAHVRRVEPSAFRTISALGVEEQRVNVVVDIDSPRDAWSSLGDGFRVEADIVLWSGEALRAPASSVFRHGEGWAVYVVVEGRAVLREVTVGRRSASHVEIRRGLADGDEVVAYPSDRVGPDVRVDTIRSP